ncbi:hypothetical protein [Kitasatospora sp. McL0602]|uniref:hypothetical protein n=1 Tax=Kitasatospora sp. McL0602 TaxID=3439530 RepID=UPI003F88FBF1
MTSAAQLSDDRPDPDGPDGPDGPEVLTTEAPTAWEPWARLGLTTAACYLAAAVGQLAFTVYQTAQLLDLLATIEPGDSVDTALSLLHTATWIGYLQVVTVLAAVAGHMFFRHKVRAAATAAGLETRSLARHWSRYAGLACLAVYLLVTLAVRHAPTYDVDVMALVQQDAIHAEISIGVRIVTALVLVAATLSLRSRARAVLTAPVGEPTC